jgi:hypothetical protein
VTAAFLLVLELLAIGITLLAAYFWWQASGVRIRRIEKTEELNSLDINRIIVSINRSQLLNRRAALASALSALIIAIRFTAGLIAN